MQFLRPDLADNCIRKIYISFIYSFTTYAVLLFILLYTTENYVRIYQQQWAFEYQLSSILSYFPEFWKEGLSVIERRSFPRQMRPFDPESYPVTPRRRRLLLSFSCVKIFITAIKFIQRSPVYDNQKSPAEK